MAPSSGGGDAAPSYNNVVFGDAKSRKNVAKKHLINPPTSKFITRRSKILSIPPLAINYRSPSINGLYINLKHGFHINKKRSLTAFSLAGYPTFMTLYKLPKAYSLGCSSLLSISHSLPLIFNAFEAS